MRVHLMQVSANSVRLALAGLAGFRMVPGCAVPCSDPQVMYEYRLMARLVPA